MNEEYLSYVDYLKSIDFSKRLEILKEKYAGKKVILFGMGLFLDAIIDNYDLKDYLNITGISDMRLKDDKLNEYKGFNVYKPRAIPALNVNLILDTNILFKKTKKFLKDENLIRNGVKLRPIIQISLIERCLDFFKKQLALVNYLAESYDFWGFIKYQFICSRDEIESKANYVKCFKRIKASKTPVRTAFVCSNTRHTEFMRLYNILCADDTFKLYPIILVPETLLDSEKADEASMQANIDKFMETNTQVIQGWESDLKSLPSLHAFKPDLIFYQDLIYTKDDFCPHRMSENALCFSIGYNVEESDFAAMGSKYFRKQAANMWKIFVSSEADKTLYTEYTDLKGKNIVETTGLNLTTQVYRYLRALFLRQNDQLEDS